MVSTGEFGGDTSFGGCGAGGDPTAVAVVSDLLQAARFRRGETQAWQRPRLIPCEPMSDLPRRHYVRFLVRDRPGILAELSSAFARQHINLDAVLQNPGHAKEELPFVITLEPCGSSPLQAALAEIAQCDFLVEPPVRMPIVD
jgi:homoserine dehydrogenase